MSKVSVDKFFVEKDYRVEREGLGELATSIHDVGLINPIRTEEIDGKYKVTAGRRRFYAMTEFLEMTELEEGRHFYVDNSVNELVVQFAENMDRQDFRPIETAKLVKDIHEANVEIHGRAVKGSGGGWGIANTAALVGKTKSFISKLLTIANNEKLIAECDTLTEALSKVEKTQAKKVAETISKAKAKAQKAKDETPISKLIGNFENMEAVEFLKKLPDKSVDLIFTDPPFGINLDETTSSEAYQGKYEDNPETIKKLIENCVYDWYRVLKDGRYIIVWTGFHYYARLCEHLRNAGFTVPDVPLVWIKLNSSGKTMIPEKRCGNVVMQAAYGYKGDAELAVKGRTNTFPHPIIRKNRIHVAQMPESLIVDILKIFSYPGQTVLDSFVGSGAVLRACHFTKRGFVGSEKDSATYNAAINYTYEWNQERNEQVEDEDLVGSDEDE